MNFALPANSTVYNKTYTITKTLGNGGGSYTYLAINQLGKKFTIKELFVFNNCRRGSQQEVLFEDLEEEQIAKIKNRFRAEGQLLLDIQKKKIPHVAQVQNLFSENNTLYLVLNYVEGESLEEIVKKQGPLFFQNILPWVNQVGNALAELHRNNLFHLDVKPGNVIITPQNEAVLIDFGLTTNFQDHSNSQELGFSKQFASPEQMNATAQANPLMDIYGFAATICFLLTGSAELSVKGQKFADQFIGLSQEQINCLELGLAHNPSDRPKSIFELVNILNGEDHEDRTVLPETQINQSSSPSKPLAPPTHQKRSSKGFTLYLTGMVILVTLALAYFKFNSSFANIASIGGEKDPKPSNTPPKTPDEEKESNPDNTSENASEDNPSDTNQNNESNEVAPPVSKPKSGSQKWTGSISKRGKPDRHLVNMEIRINPEVNADSRNKVQGSCIIRDAARQSNYVRFDISGYYDEENSKLHLESGAPKEQHNFNYCQFKGDFHYIKGTKSIEANFNPVPGSGATRSACRPFMLSSKIQLTLK